MSLFFEGLPIYYINLEYRKDRNTSMLNQFKDLGIKLYTRVNAVDKNNVQEFSGMSKSQVACSTSHIFALIEFLKSNNDFAMIAEDDSDLSNSSKLCFNFYDIVEDSDQDYCLQTCVVTREEDFLYFFNKSRSFWDFGTTSYIVNKKYAQKIVDMYYYNGSIHLDNFESKNIIDPRGGTIKTVPVADELIYSLCETKVLPLFTFHVSDSDIGNGDEYYRQFTKSREMFTEHWNLFESISIENLGL